MIIQKLKPSKTEVSKLYSIFCLCFKTLSVNKNIFINRIIKNGTNFIFYVFNRKIIGYAVIEDDNILMIAVLPLFQNKGIGSNIFKKVEDLISIKFNKISIVAENYLFCGVPIINSNIIKWFEKQGFIFTWSPCDLILDLKNFNYTNNLKNFNIKLQTSKKNPQLISECLDAVKQINKNWIKLYKNNKKHILYALSDNKLVGALIYKDKNFIFNFKHIKQSYIQAVYVVKEFRNKGIGSYLCKNAFKILKNKSRHICYINYTYLEEWYKSFGCEVFLKYWIGEKILHEK